MTPEQFLEAMKQIYPESRNYDFEAAHIEADTLMCNVLRELGYGEGVCVFVEAERWYA